MDKRSSYTRVSPLLGEIHILFDVRAPQRAVNYYCHIPPAFGGHPSSQIGICVCVCVYSSTARHV